MSELNQKIVVWWGLAFAFIYFLAIMLFMGFVPPPPVMLDTEAIVQFYAEKNLQFRIGVVIAIIAAAFEIPWTTAVCAQMRRLEEGFPVWTLVQLAGGYLSAILFVLPPLFWGVAAFTVDRNPEITVFMHELAFLTFITPVSVFLFQGLSVAFVSFQQKDGPFSPFPRWVGFFTIWMTLIAECGVFAQLVKTGPFAWNGLFTFWLPLTVYGVWFVVVSYTMLKAIGAQRKAGSGA